MPNTPGPDNSTHILLEMRRKRLEADMTPHVAEEEAVHVTGGNSALSRDSNLDSIEEAHEHV